MSEVKCPEPGCEYSGPTGHQVSVHWSLNDSHSGDLSDHYPDFDTSRREGFGDTIASALEGRERTEEEREAVSEALKSLDNDEHGGWTSEPLTEEHKEKMSEALSGRTLSEEHKKNISESLKGRTHSEDVKRRLSEVNEGKTLSEETKSKISKTNVERWEQMAEEERRKVGENISQGLKEYWQSLSAEEFEEKHPGIPCDSFYSEELGHMVRSRWEEAVGLVLEEAEVDYGFEVKYFDLDEMRYLPDFFVSDSIIEVKGPVSDRDIRKAELFMKQYPEYTYIVVGSQIPSDVHIDVSGTDDIEDKSSRILEVLRQ